MRKSELSAHLPASFSVSGITIYSVSLCPHLLSMSGGFSLLLLSASHSILISFLLPLLVFLCLISILWGPRSFMLEMLEI